MKKATAGLTVFVLLCGFTLLLPGGAFAVSKGEEEMRKGLKGYAAKEFASAAARFEKASALLEKEKKLPQAGDAAYNEGLCRRNIPFETEKTPADHAAAILAAFDRSAALYVKAKEETKAANALLQGAQTALAAARLSDAETRYAEALSRAKKIKSDMLQGLSLEGLGKVAFQRARVDESRRLFADALERLHSVPTARSRVALQLIASLRKAGDMPGTLERLEEAEKELLPLEKDEKTRSVAGFLRFLVLAERGHTFLQMGIFHKAQENLRAALEFDENNPLIGEEIRLGVEGNKLVAEGELGNPMFSADALETLRRMAEHMGLRDLECASLISAGRLLRVDGKYAEAMLAFEKAAGIAREAGLGSRYVQAVLAKANLMYFQGMWKASENAYRMAFNGAFEQGDMESVLVAVLGIERIARANHMGMSGKMDYRKMQGVPWRGALLQGKNILPSRGGNALPMAWRRLGELSREWFAASEPGLRGALAVEAAAEILAWNRMKNLSRHLVAEGVLRLVSGRNEMVFQVVEALRAMEKERMHAADPAALSQAYRACWDALEHGAGKGLLGKKGEPADIQIDGILLIPPPQHQNAKASAKASPPADLQRLLATLAEALNSLSMKDAEQRAVVRALLNGESMPDPLASQLLRTFAARTVADSKKMEQRLSGGDAAARKEFAGILLDALDRLGSSPLDEIRGNDKLARYIQGIESESSEERMQLAESLALSTPPFLVYSLREACRLSDIHNAWRGLALRALLLRNLGVLGEAKTLSLRQGVDHFANSLTKGAEAFEKQCALMDTDSSREREEKIARMLSLAEELTRAELAAQLAQCRAVGDAPEGAVGFDDRQAMKELVARYFLALGETEQALNIAEDIRANFGFSARSTGGMPNPEVVWRTLLVSAKASLVLDAVPNAVRFLDQAIEVMESVSPSDGTNSQATADKLDVYRTAVETAYSLYAASPSDEHAAMLWRYLEGMKSRQWREMLATTGAAFLDRLPESEEERYRTLGMSAAQLLAKIAFLDFRGLAKEADEARAELQDVRRTLGEITARHTVDSVQRIPTLDEASDALHPDWAAASYYLSRELSFAFVLGKGEKPRLVRLPLDYDGFFAYTLWMRTLPEAVEFQSARANEAVMAAGVSSPRLAKQLFEPVAQLVGEKKKLLVIPHDLLYTFPFETMSVARGDTWSFLLDEGWTFAELPSAFLLEKARRTEATSGKKRLVVIADPEYYPELRKKHGAEEARKILLGGVENPLVQQIRDAFCKYMAPLRNARREGEYLVEQWKGVGEVRSLMGADASEKMLYDPETKVWDAQHVHIVCHGYDRNSIPDLQPGLALSPVADSRNDSFAQMGELASLRWRSDLVVLSACDTGLGDLFIGDGMVGLNTVFLAGGAKGMLISRWRVPDESAPEFMNGVYERIVSGETPVDALTSAKRELKKTYGEASHWAVFKYVGIPW